MADKIQVKIEALDNLTPILERLSKTLEKLNITLNKFASAMDLSAKSTSSSISKSVKNLQDLDIQSNKTAKSLDDLAKSYRNLSKLSIQKMDLGKVDFSKIKIIKPEIKKDKKSLLSDFDVDGDLEGISKLNKALSELQDKQFINWRQQFLKNSFNLEKQYNLERIRMIENSNKILLSNIKDILVSSNG